MGNPFIKNIKIFAVYLLIWVFITIIHNVVIVFLLDVKIEQAFTESIVYNTLYFLLGISLWYTVSYNTLENYTAVKIFMNHSAAAVITSAVWVLAGYYILISIYDEDAYYKTYLFNSGIWRFMIGILFYSITVAVDYVIIYYHNFQQKLFRESELNALVKEAELKSLKYQINPHFIFNSLNSISSLTLSNPEKAREMTIKLSAFLRSTLSKNEKQKSKLTDEISNASLYLDIEKVRFSDKIEFVQELKSDCMDLEIPSMILQPLFENAVKHGVYESLDKVVIKLKCSPDKEYLKIIVENNYDPESVPRKGEGIGIKNIQQRMKLIYNQDNLLTVEKLNGLFRVIIYVPR
ncbi:MAG: histidine kinase [Bacteroidota bacterium]|jgi:two-component sensor histidine kinase